MNNKIKTVIASVLKPVDDTRMYEKFGLSLQQTNRYAVNIIGFVSKNPSRQKDILFHPLFNFKKNSWKRFFVSFGFVKYLFQNAPQLIIITTYELLPAAILYKICQQKVRIVYDVRENYALNLITNRGTGFFNYVFAKIIRLLEKYSQRYISLNILAEETYAKEISFFSSNYVYVFNKYSQINNQKKGVPTKITIKADDAWPIFVYNGTVSENYGILEVLDFVKQMHAYFPKLLLIIIGHVTDAKLLKHLLKLEKQLSYVVTWIDQAPVPHQNIMACIEIADVGLVAHRPVESIRNCFPTRIYEYMAYRKPFILQDHPFWTSFCEPWKCSINVDFGNFDPQFVAQQLKSGQFYPNGISNDIYWDTESVKLIQAIDNLF